MSESAGGGAESPASSGLGRRLEGRRIAFGALLALSLALNVAGIGWGLGGAWTWALDEIRPGQVLAPESWSDKYPPLHRLLLTLVVKPADALIGSLGSLDSVSWQQRTAWLVLVQRAVSLLAAVGVVLLVFRTAGEILGPRARLPAAVVAALSPTFVYYAKTANLEMAYLFWFTLSLFFFARAWAGGRGRDFVLCSIAAIAAVTTKDQAYGLYPVLMAASLWRIGRDHAGPASLASRVGRTLSDRRVWASVLAAAVAFAGVYALSGGAAGLQEHVEKIVGHNTMKYRTYDADLSGFLAMAWSALGNVAFLTGWPLFAAALLGAALAVRRRRTQSLLVVLALVPVGYFLSFIWVVGFHYVRFFLPLLPILAILAARAWIAAAARFPRAATPAAVVVMAWALVRCLGVDAAMLTDTRYEARAFLDERPAAERALGIGRVPVLPKDLETALWGQVRPFDCEFFDRERPERVVFNVNDLRTEREIDVVRGLELGQINYDLERRFLPRVEPPGWGSTRSNLMFVSPEIRIYRRADRPCLDKTNFAEVLGRPSSRGDAELERVLIDLLLRREWGTIVDAEGRAALFGTTFGGWTRATQPAILALENPGDEPLRVALRLAVAAPAEYRPVPVRVQEGAEVHKLRFARQTLRTVQLADLGPGEERLVWIWSKKAWPGQEKQPRKLGVKLAELELAAAEP